MVDRYIQFLGLDETLKFLRANETQLKPSIRVNTLKISATELKNRLEKKGFELKPIQCVPYGFNVIKETYNLGSLHEYLQGYFYLQNVASMLAAIILDPKPNDTVIDMCAAPGSKATHIAQLMENKGKLILIDRNKSRIPALEVNLRRMGVINSIIINMDATYLSKLNIQVDRVLLDAPCTGEGLIRQDSRRKKSKKLSDIEKMASIQRNLLISGLKILKIEGKLLYCTCSIAPEENELVVNEVLDDLNNFSIEKISMNYGVNGLTKVFGKTLKEELVYSKRLYPHIHDTIGFFLCLIKRTN